MFIGCIWGVTNPFIKSGSATVSAKRGQSPPNSHGLVLYLKTPSFLIPQVLNLCGSLAFAALLSVGELSVVAPIANATALAANTVTDLILGERYNVGYLSSGLGFVAVGIWLCTGR